MKEFMTFLKESPVCFFAVKNLAKMFEDAGFRKLPAHDAWNIEAGGKYYVTFYDSSIYAFSLPEDLGKIKAPVFRMISAHTDYPCFRVKPCEEIRANGYRKLNVEVYGGPIFSTWLDRPLSLAGRVTLKSEDPFHPDVHYVDLKKPVLVIPNLAIHMNRNANSGVELNPQVDMLPVGGLMSGLSEDSEQMVTEALCRELNVSADAILDFDLFTYNLDEPKIVGFHEEFLSAPRLDDLVMAYTAATALIQSKPVHGINVFLGFDHEEIGSRSAQGADSMTVSYALEKLCESLHYSRIEYLDMMAGSFLISGDVAHAIHPNHPEKHDPVLKTQLNGGPVIKQAARQSYMTQSVDDAVYEAFCIEAGVPVQKFVNRSDQRGGGTLGPVVSSHLPCRIMDMGIPLLSMHSSRELMGVLDYDYTVRSFVAYYNA